MNLVPILSLLLAAPLAAQGFAVLGTWELTEAPDLPAILEAATAPMNFIIRPIARARLRKTNPVYRRIRIERSGGEFIIQYEDRQTQRMPADGRAVEWRREDGERLRIAARAERDDLVQTYHAEDGDRINRFHVDPGTRALQLQVTVTSGRLPGPVTYTLAYRPVGD